jgi:hypothetical protein
VLEKKKKKKKKKRKKVYFTKIHHHAEFKGPALNGLVFPHKFSHYDVLFTHTDRFLPQTITHLNNMAS